jgi:LytTr DNA-binding domain
LAGFLAALRADVRSGVPVIIWLTLTFAVVISGPFGSYANHSMIERLLYWPPILAVAVAMSVTLRAFVSGGLGYCDTVKAAFLTAFLVAAALSPLIFLAVGQIFDPVFGGLFGFSEIFLMVGSVSLGVCSLRVATEPATFAPGDPVAAVADVPRLLRRLDPALQGDLWAITVRDHYVDVQTSAGKSSLLLRFSDAIAEAEPVAGAQVHRSHWVAWDGVGSVCREGGKMRLHLKNGDQIPVSRNHRDKVDARFAPQAALKDAAA